MDIFESLYYIAGVIEDKTPEEQDKILNGFSSVCALLQSMGPTIQAAVFELILMAIEKAKEEMGGIDA